MARHSRSSTSRAAAASLRPAGLHRKDALEALRLELLRPARPGAVHVAGQGDRRVSELRLDPGELRASLKGDPRERVPKRVERSLAAALADTLDIGTRHRGVERLQYRPTVQVAALVPLEDKAQAGCLGIPLLEEPLRLRSQIHGPRLTALRGALSETGCIRLRNEDLTIK